MTSRPVWFAITVGIVVACARHQPTTPPIAAKTATACACQPESPETGRETLECFCRNGGECPDTLNLAFERLSKVRERDRDASLVRSDGCGLIAITLSNGLFAEVFIYDATSRGLVGASFTGDLCAGPCSCSIVAGVNTCPNAKACLVSGRGIDSIPRCDVEAQRPIMSKHP